jgi:hypothetical protein
MNSTMATAGSALAAAPPPATAEQGAPPGRPAAERLGAGLQQQLNLESVKARAVGLFKAISRILEDFDMYSRTTASPKWCIHTLSLFLFLRIIIVFGDLPVYTYDANRCPSCYFVTSEFLPVCTFQLDMLIFLLKYKLNCNL